MSNNPNGQQLCEFSVPASALNKTNNKYCMHLGKVIKDHCDCVDAQLDIKCGGKEYVAPLSEEEVFDVTNRDTYPEYRE